MILIFVILCQGEIVIFVEKAHKVVALEFICCIGGSDAVIGCDGGVIGSCSRFGLGWLGGRFSRFRLRFGFRGGFPWVCVAGGGRFCVTDSFSNW